jgi:hypothetical protein
MIHHPIGFFAVVPPMVITPSPVPARVSQSVKSGSELTA